MNINRYNYEEYFILYMDNELKTEDRLQVEDFVQKHPDLKEELEMLLQYKMEPDTSIVFSDKNELMIHDYIPNLTENNYKQWLTLYIDNELNSEQKTSVDLFVAMHPSIKEELNLLQKAKLQPEEIIFPEKSTLYRETADRPVITMHWWKIAAAAILVFIVGALAVIALNKKAPIKEDLAVSPKVEQKTIKENPVANNSIAEKSADEPIIADATHHHVDVAKSNQKNNSEIIHKTIGTKKSLNNIPVIQKENIVAVNNQQPSNNLPKPVNNPYVNNVPKDAMAHIDPPKENIKPNQSISDIVTTNTIQPSQVVYNAPDNNELNQSGGKKSKLRGFLRKVARTFEKTTNIDPADDENRLLVGGLAFKLN